MSFASNISQRPSVIDALLEKVSLPLVAPVTQMYDRPQVQDMEAAVRRCMQGRLAGLKKGQSVAITAGSRGITNLPLALRTVVRAVREAGAEPFIVPAMGSHGGACAEGQAALLKGLGIEERTVEAPVRSSMETVVVGHCASGLPAHMDRHAAYADAVIVVNRVKPHTSFRGPVESGLLKMLVIGLGKQKGADICHEQGFGHMAENIPALAGVILRNKPILCGIGIIENAFHETAQVVGLGPEDMMEREPELLKEAWRLAPRIFFDALDVLVIDEIGKDISGTGFDTNVVGRYHNPHAYGGPAITRLATLDITDKSKGNANGIGMADFITRRAFDKFSPEQTYPNALTSTVPLPVKIPMVLANDRQALQAAVKTCNAPDKNAIRLVRIKNTIDMVSIWVSEALLPACQEHPNLEVTGPVAPFSFNAQGNLW